METKKYKRNAYCLGIHRKIGLKQAYIVSHVTCKFSCILIISFPGPHERKLERYRKSKNVVEKWFWPELNFFTLKLMFIWKPPKNKKFCQTPQGVLCKTPYFVKLQGASRKDFLIRCFVAPSFNDTDECQIYQIQRAWALKAYSETLMFLNQK